ncbi:F-box/LRR-repeat protein [Trifolium repens]|nr:F-box/LRR-repeat protein [Trifolium repens]
MKRKRTSSSSSQQTVTATCSQLPDECWEFIFRLVINDDDENRNKLRYLNPLSLVSKQFLSVTDRLRFSLTVYYEYEPSYLDRIFKRFTNLNSLKLVNFFTDSDELLRKIPSKQLTSLHLSNQPSIPTNGLRAFSQKITTLTSFNCSCIGSLNTSDLFLIAECFPLLEQLDLSDPSGCTDYSSYVDGVEALSLALIKLRKVNLSGFPINNQSLYHLFNNCKYLEEVIILKCGEITSAGLASAIRHRPTLRSLLFSTTELTDVSTSQFIDSLVSLKGLTCLVLHCLNISDELLYSIAREGLPLTRLDLIFCPNYSYNGIFCLLSKCRRIQHLNLQHTRFLNDQHVAQLSLFLGDLVSINLSDCDKITKSALFALLRNCPSLSEIKMERIVSDRDIVGNSDSLVKFGVYPHLKGLYLGGNSWLNDEILIMVTSIFPNLQLLDLNDCHNISEGICQVLRKCCKIKHLNLAYCSRVKLHGMNFVVPKLEVLNLSDTKVDDETLYLISKNCSGLMQLRLDRCSGVTKKGVKCMLKSCRQLRENGCIIPSSQAGGVELVTYKG